MKKILLALLILSILVFLSLKFGWRELLTPGAVKKVRTTGVEEMKKEADESAKRYRSQLESAEKVKTNYEKLGRRYADNGNWTPAIESFTMALGYGSVSADIHYMLGVSYANRAKETDSKDDIIMAESHYGKAIARNPEFLSAQYGLGLLVFYLKKDHAGGIEIMKKLNAYKPDFFEGRFALGRFYYESGQPALALSVYENLYSALQDKKNSTATQEMRDNCKTNIARIANELQIQRVK